MAKNRPVKIWIIRHRPNKDPKFHSELILLGEGSSINEPLIILIKGWIFKIDIIFVNYKLKSIWSTGCKFSYHRRINFFTWFY